MVMQQLDHVINKGVCVCVLRERGSTIARGMREDEEEGEEEEGYCEWLQAATQVRDFFSKVLNRERERDEGFSHPPVGRRGGGG